MPPGGISAATGPFWGRPAFEVFWAAAESICLSMIFSENRFPLFWIML
jgi:hypothetical protein